jgi:hypothetical protein
MRNEEVTHHSSKWYATRLIWHRSCIAQWHEENCPAKLLRSPAPLGISAGKRLLTCQLDREGRQDSYTLSLVPHWDVRQAASETFDAGVSAFRRHAAVADQLRRQGWTLAAYSVAR